MSGVLDHNPQPITARPRSSDGELSAASVIEQDQSPSSKSGRASNGSSLKRRDKRPSVVSIKMKPTYPTVGDQTALTIEVSDTETVLARVLETLTAKFPPESVVTITSKPRPSMSSSDSSSSTSILEIYGVELTRQKEGSPYSWIKLADGSVVGYIDAHRNVHILPSLDAPALMPRIAEGGHRTNIPQIFVTAASATPYGLSLLTDRNGNVIGDINVWGEPRFRVHASIDRSQGPRSTGPYYGQPWRLVGAPMGSLPGTVAVAAEEWPSVKEWLVDPTTGDIMGHTETDGQLKKYPRFPPTTQLGLRLQVSGTAGDIYLTTPDGTVVGHADASDQPVIHPNCPGAARPDIERLPRDISVLANISNPEQPLLIDARGQTAGHLTDDGQLVLALRNPSGAKSVNQLRGPACPAEGYRITDGAGRIIGHADKEGRPVCSPTAGETTRVAFAEGQVSTLSAFVSDKNAEAAWLVDDRGNVVGHYDVSGRLVLHPLESTIPGARDATEGTFKVHLNAGHSNRLIPKDPAKPGDGHWLVSPEGKTIGQVEPSGRAVVYPRFPARLKDAATGQPVGPESIVPGVQFHPRDPAKPDVGGPWISDDAGRILGHYGPDGKPLLHLQLSHGGRAVGLDASIPGTVLVPQNPSNRDLGSWIIDIAGRCVGHTTPNNQAVMYPKLPRRQVDPSTGRPVGPDRGVPGVNFVPRDPTRPDIGGPWLVDDDGLVIGHYGSDRSPIFHPQFNRTVGYPQVVSSAAQTGELPQFRSGRLAQVVKNPSRPQDGAWLVDTETGRTVGHTACGNDSQQIIYPHFPPPPPGTSHPNIPGLHFVPMSPISPELGGPWIIDDDGFVVGHFRFDGAVQLLSQFIPGPQPTSLPNLIQCPAGPLPGTAVVPSRSGDLIKEWIVNTHDGVVLGHLDDRGRTVIYPRLPRASLQDNGIPGVHFVAFNPRQPELGGPWLSDDEGNVLGHFGVDGRPVWLPQYPAPDGRQRPMRPQDQYAVVKDEERRDLGCWIVDPLSRLPVGEILPGAETAHMFPVYMSGQQPQGQPGPVAGTVLIAKDAYRPTKEGSWLVDNNGQVVGEVDAVGQIITTKRSPCTAINSSIPLVPVSVPSTKPILATQKDPGHPECGAWILDAATRLALGEITPSGDVRKFPQFASNSRPPGSQRGTVMVGKDPFYPESVPANCWLVDSAANVVGETDASGHPIPHSLPPNKRAPRSARPLPVVAIPGVGYRPAVTVPKTPEHPAQGSWVIDPQTHQPVGEIDGNGYCHMIPENPFGPVTNTDRIPKDSTHLAAGYWLVDTTGNVTGEADSCGNTIVRTYGPASVIPWSQLPPPTVPLPPHGASMPVVSKSPGGPVEGGDKWILDPETRIPIGELSETGCTHMFPDYPLGRRPQGPAGPVFGTVMVLKDVYCPTKASWLVDVDGRVIGETDSQGIQAHPALLPNARVSESISAEYVVLPSFPGPAPLTPPPSASHSQRNHTHDPNSAHPIDVDQSRMRSSSVIANTVNQATHPAEQIRPTATPEQVSMIAAGPGFPAVVVPVGLSGSTHGVSEKYYQAVGAEPACPPGAAPDSRRLSRVRQATGVVHPLVPGLDLVAQSPALQTAASPFPGSQSQPIVAGCGPFTTPSSPQIPDWTPSPTLQVGKQLQCKLPPFEEILQVPVDPNNHAKGGFLFKPSGSPIGILRVASAIEAFPTFPPNTRPEASVPGPKPNTWSLPRNPRNPGDGWLIIDQATGEVCSEYGADGIVRDFPKISSNFGPECVRPWASYARQTQTGSETSHLVSDARTTNCHARITEPAAFPPLPLLEKVVYVPCSDNPQRQWIANPEGGRPVGEIGDDHCPVIFPTYPPGERPTDAVGPGPFAGTWLVPREKESSFYVISPQGFTTEIRQPPHSVTKLPALRLISRHRGFYDIPLEPGPLPPPDLHIDKPPRHQLPPGVAVEDISVVPQFNRPDNYWLTRSDGRPVGRVSVSNGPEFFPTFRSDRPSRHRRGPLLDTFLVPKQTVSTDGEQWIVDVRGEVVGEHTPKRGALFRLFPTQRVTARTLRPWTKTTVTVATPWPQRSGVATDAKLATSPTQELSVRRLETPKPEEKVTYIEIPVVKEVVTNKPVRRVREILKKIPVPKIVEVEKVIEVPEITYVDKFVDGPEQIEWRDKIQKTRQIVEVPREEVRYVPVPQIVFREETVAKPVPTLREIRLETPVEISVPNVKDLEVPTVVARKYTPVFKMATESKEFVVKQYEPVLIPTEIFIPVPVKIPIVASSVMDTSYRCVDVSAPHWNSLITVSNKELLTRKPNNDRYLPWFRESRSGLVPTLPPDERVDIVPPSSEAWRSAHTSGRIHVTAAPEYSMDCLESIVNEIVETQLKVVQERRAEVERQVRRDRHNMQTQGIDISYAKQQQPLLQVSRGSLLSSDAGHGSVVTVTTTQLPPKRDS